jgi:hypothetical protein
MASVPVSKARGESAVEERFMQFRGPISILIGCVLLATAVPGCLTLERSRQVDVIVQDAETGKPISAAKVCVSHFAERSAFAPHESSGVTGANGVARVEAVPNAEFCIWLEAKAAGYLSDSRDVCAEMIRQGEPDSWLPIQKHPALRLTVALYAEPRFCIEWTVPTGFRGLIKAVVNYDKDFQCPPAQRCFRFDVPASGEVPITVLGLLKRYTPLYRARYADGSPVSEDMDALKVGFRWLRSDGDNEYFVVGTQVDYENFRRLSGSHPSGSESQGSDGSKGRSRGGRRNRGNPAASTSP